MKIIYFSFGRIRMSGNGKIMDFKINNGFRRRFKLVGLDLCYIYKLREVS